ncbi:hypothetical protein KYS33_004286 [Salmonella enterica]|nr:hypothetical protein [Salmonella enterica]
MTVRGSPYSRIFSVFQADPSNYKIQHDKVIIVDGRHVETGSFNYTASAEKYNSENAIVMWDAPELAGQYLKHWQSRWNQGRDFTPSY